MEVLEVDASGDYDYGSFFAGLEAQLARLEGSEEPTKREMVRCYCMMAVFREDDKVPLDAVRRLWSKDEEGTAGVGASQPLIAQLEDVRLLIPEQAAAALAKLAHENQAADHLVDRWPDIEEKHRPHEGQRYVEQAEGG